MPLPGGGQELPAGDRKRVLCLGAGSSAEPAGSGRSWVMLGLGLPCPASLPLVAELSHPG